MIPDTAEFLTGCPSCGADGGRHAEDCDDLDRRLLDHAYVGVHPLHNEATVRLAVTDLVRMLEALGRRPAWIY